MLERKHIMKAIHLAVATIAATALVPLTATAALAAAPDNDRPEGARPVTLGQTVSEDTSDATTGSLDAKLNQICGAPFTNASVWFTYDAATAGTVILDMSQSDYTGGFMVFLGKPTLNSFRGCGPESIGVATKADKTYTIAAFSDSSVNGGNLKMSLEAGPPPPSFSATVDADGKAFKNGNAQVTGTLSCENADFVDEQGTLTQIWKRVKITGSFFREITGDLCDGADHAWKKTISSDNGLYADGDATLTFDAVACGLIDCVRVRFDPQPVMLHGPGSQAAGSGATMHPGVHVTSVPRAPLTWKAAQSG